MDSRKTICHAKSKLSALSILSGESVNGTGFYTRKLLFLCSRYHPSLKAQIFLLKTLKYIFSAQRQVFSPVANTPHIHLTPCISSTEIHVTAVTDEAKHTHIVTYRTGG